MNKGSSPIRGFFNNLFGKNETESPATRDDDIDVEYYRGDYRTSRPTPEAPAPTVNETVTEPQHAPAPAKQPEPTPKADDFEFFDEDDEIDETPVRRPAEPTPNDNSWGWENGDETEPRSVRAPETEPEETPEEDEEEYARVSVVENATLGDASSIADLVLDGSVAIVKIDKLSKEEKIRMFDFLTGVVYAAKGEMKKLFGGRCVIAAPEGFTSEDIDDLIRSIFPGAEV